MDVELTVPIPTPTAPPVVRGRGRPVATDTALGALINARGVSVGEVVRATGISQAMLTRYINGLFPLSAKSRAILAEYFNVPPIALGCYDAPNGLNRDGRDYKSIKEELRREDKRARDATDAPTKRDATTARAERATSTFRGVFG